MFKSCTARGLLSACCLLMLVLNACATSSKPPPPQHVQAHAAHGGTWIDDLYEDPTSLIPFASPLTTAAIADQTLFAPLFYGDANGVLHPGLATELPTMANGG